MATLADRILQALAEAGRPLDDDELALLVGADRHAVNAACRKLFADGRIIRSKTVGSKVVNRLATLVGSSRPPTPPPPPPRLTGGPSDGASFEAHARRVLSDQWGLSLASRVLTLRRGVTHSFDLVSDDGSVVGDAKWYKDLRPIPAAKLSVIAEYVWLLGNLEHATRRFLIFGQDRAVPERWLTRFRTLLDGTEFWFLDGRELSQLA